MAGATSAEIDEAHSFAARLSEMEVIEATQAYGQALSTVRARSNVIRIWDMMRLHEKADQELKALVHSQWADLDEATLCSRRP